MRGLKPRTYWKSDFWPCRIFYRCVDWNIKINRRSKSKIVASFTDAWIETVILVVNIGGCESHLLQMRGLKQRSIIDTLKSITSHLLQMRGLKPVGSNSLIAVRRSHLLQMRGLKQLAPWLTEPLNRRIFYRCVDWNFQKRFYPAGNYSRIFYRCVDWNYIKNR